MPILTGIHVRLEPLTYAHLDGMCAVAFDPSIWTWFATGPLCDRGDAERFITRALEAQAAGMEEPYAIIRQRDGAFAGSTRFMEMRPLHRGLEIGTTWLAPPFQRTALNTETKLLLLTRAFEDLRCIRVQLKTHARNLPSQRAIERIGGVLEGTLRQHMIMADGTLRDSVYYSILDSEWPIVRDRLRERLERLAP